MIQERPVSSLNGLAVMTILLPLLLVFGLLFTASFAASSSLAMTSLGVVVLASSCLLLFGFYNVHPNQARVLQLFGRYAGSDRQTGLRWANPFYTQTAVSLRVRNFESSKLKVNDANGNPIEIAAVVVWRVVDSAEATFEVDNYENYVTIQSEAALRNLATSYPYEDHAESGTGVALRSHATEVAQKLQEEVQARLQKAGVEVLEARLSHLAYAPEIAQAMLQRQQASAVLAARRIIVQGAVGMVSAALEQLAAQEVVALDAERKAAMVSNLLVVLCGDQGAKPVINAGTLY